MVCHRKHRKIKLKVPARKKKVHKPTQKLNISIFAKQYPAGLPNLHIIQMKIQKGIEQQTRRWKDLQLASFCKTSPAYFAVYCKYTAYRILCWPSRLSVKFHKFFLAFSLYRAEYEIKVYAVLKYTCMLTKRKRCWQEWMQKPENLFKFFATPVSRRHLKMQLPFRNLVCTLMKSSNPKTFLKDPHACIS